MTRQEASLTVKQIGIRKLHKSIGAEVSGVNLATALTDETFSYICDSLLKHKVLVFRRQNITPEQHVAFARRFGPLEINPTDQGEDASPFVTRVTKNRGSFWQSVASNSDMTWRARPPMGSVMRVVDGPKSGSIGQFIDTEAAYNSLSPAKKDFACSLLTKHDIAQTFVGLSLRESMQIKAKFPAQVHPMVRTHPETRNRLLFINKAYTASIFGMSPQSSKWLLDWFLDVLYQPEHVMRFHWTPGTVVLWDSRACQYHEDVEDVPSDHIMERVSITGDRPFFEPQLANTAMRTDDFKDTLEFNFAADLMDVPHMPKASNAA
jgi:taurine dioxygenase